MKFLFDWTESKNPRTVTFPDGHVEEVSYMRDGICLFKSSVSATYERHGEGSAEFTVIESHDEAKDAVAAYAQKQPRAVPAYLTPAMEKVLAYIRRHPNSTVAQIQAGTALDIGVTTAAIRYLFHNMYITSDQASERFSAKQEKP